MSLDTMNHPLLGLSAKMLCDLLNKLYLDSRDINRDDPKNGALYHLFGKDNCHLWSGDTTDTEIVACLASPAYVDADYISTLSLLNGILALAGSEWELVKLDVDEDNGHRIFGLMPREKSEEPG